MASKDVIIIDIAGVMMIKSSPCYDKGLNMPHKKDAEVLPKCTDLTSLGYTPEQIKIITVKAKSSLPATLQAQGVSLPHNSEDHQ